MSDKKLSMAELKNKSLSFDRGEMRDLYAKKENDEYLCKRHMAVWNIDKNMLACIASKNYSVIQHRHATESLIDAVTSLNLKAIAELKTSKHGIHIDFDFPDAQFELKEVGEKFTSGIRIVNDYSLQGMIISPRVTRLVCSNGMIVTDIIKSQRIKYTEQLNVTVEGIIDKIIKDIITNDDKLANVVSICMKDSVEWNTLKLLLKLIFKKKKIVREIFSRIKTDKERVNRWQFYNAVTQYATHGERLRPHVESWLQNKAQLILKTSFNELAEINKPAKEENKIAVQSQQPLPRD